MLDKIHNTFEKRERFLIIRILIPLKIIPTVEKKKTLSFKINKTQTTLK